MDYTDESWTPPGGGEPNLQQNSNQQEPPWWITRDYHAPDREDVLKDPSRWGSDPTAPTPTTPTKKTPTGDFWDQLLHSGGHNVSDLSKFLTDSGWGDAGYKQGGKKGDMITDPSGHMWDAVHAAGINGGDAFQKFDPSASSNAGYSAATGGGPGGGYPPGIGDAIQKLLTRGFSTPKADDPEIAAQLAPTNLALKRGAQRTRQAAAERAGATGSAVSGEGGSLDANINGINENLGQQEGAAAGSVIAQEVAGRRSDIVNALQFAQGEEKMALQKQLADADNELRRLGLNNQNQQFYDQLGYNMSRDTSNSDDTLSKILGLFS